MGVVEAFVEAVERAAERCRPRDADGPSIKVKVVADGVIDGKAVKAGQTVTVCERAAVRAKEVDRIVEYDAAKLTRMGTIYAAGRCSDVYREPVGALGYIPKIKVVGKQDDALVGCRVLMKGEVAELPEDVVWCLVRRDNLDGPLFTLAPGAEFSLSPRQLDAMISTQEQPFELHYHA